MTARDFECQLRGYSLTTAEILLRISPITASFCRPLSGRTTTWRRVFRGSSGFSTSGRATSMDLSPRCAVAHRGIVGAAEMRLVDAEWRLH